MAFEPAFADLQGSFEATTRTERTTARLTRQSHFDTMDKFLHDATLSERFVQEPHYTIAGAEYGITHTPPSIRSQEYHRNSLRYSNSVPSAISSPSVSMATTRGERPWPAGAERSQRAAQLRLDSERPCISPRVDYEREYIKPHVIELPTGHDGQPTLAKQSVENTNKGEKHAIIDFKFRIPLIGIDIDRRILTTSAQGKCPQRSQLRRKR